jgi:hypothetical protein
MSFQSSPYLHVVLSLVRIPMDLLSINQEKIPARNAINVHGEHFVVYWHVATNLPQSINTVQNSLHAIHNAGVFGPCVETELSIAPTISIPVISLTASSSRTALDTPTAREERLVVCGLYYCTELLIFTDVTEHVTALYSMVNSQDCTKVVLRRMGNE